MPKDSPVSLSAFNDPADEKAYQRQVREQAAEKYEGREWWPDDPDLSSARVREAAEATAEKIIHEYEWLGTLPAAASTYYGIYFRGAGETVDPYACGGVTCWSDNGGAGAHSHETFGIDSDELAYLQRGACVHWAPPNTNSKLISYSLDYERERGKKVAIAYSDRDAGEIGTVYQATGWYCLGPGKAINYFIHPETGEAYNERLGTTILRREGLDDVWTWSDIRDYMVEKGWTFEKAKPKYRYVKILADGDESARIYANIEGDIIGYPKRERDVLGESEH